MIRDEDILRLVGKMAYGLFSHFQLRRYYKFRKWLDEKYGGYFWY